MQKICNEWSKLWSLNWEKLFKYVRNCDNIHAHNELFIKYLLKVEIELKLRIFDKRNIFT